MPKGGGSNEDRAKVKLRVIEFELEGGNAAVENSIRQLTHALTTTRNAAPARDTSPKSKKEIAAGGSAAETSESEEAVEDVEYSDVEDAPQETAPAKPKPKAKPTKPRVLNNDPNLDLNGAGTITFKDFAATKNPQ